MSRALPVYMSNIRVAINMYKRPSVFLMGSQMVQQVVAHIRVILLGSHTCPTEVMSVCTDTATYGRQRGREKEGERERGRE